MAEAGDNERDILAPHGGLIKRLLPRTLFGRALLIIVSPLILLQVVSAWVFYDRHWQTVSRRLSASVAGDIALYIELSRRLDRPADIRHLVTSMAVTNDIGLRLRPGAILSNTQQMVPSGYLERTLNEALAQAITRPYTFDARSIDKQTTILVQLQDGVLEVTVPDNRLFTATTYIFVLWMVGSSLVLFAVAGIFMRNQVRPIRRLADAADAVGKGRDPGDFKVGGAREVRLAALAFRRMRDRIMRQIAQRTEMLAGVSHDLRTPLTRMKLELALLGDAREDVRELSRDVEEMERMLEGYLAFARGEGGEQTEPVAVSALLEAVASGARRAGGNVVVLAVTPFDLSADMRPQAMQRCLANLVGNAVRYARNCWIEASLDGAYVEFRVDDDGPGIAEDMRSKVFRPFVRLERSRNAATGGSGLGLSIARDIVHAHGGGITLGPSPFGGLRATIRLPV